MIMIYKHIKLFLRHNSLVNKLVVWLIELYLRLVYATAKWQYEIAPGARPENLPGAAVFVTWHNQLAVNIKLFAKYKNLSALASRHPDALLIAKVIENMGYDVIYGSSNRNPAEAVRGIMRWLGQGKKVGITPDGPRGPVYKINSNITKIAYKMQCPIVPLSSACEKYIELNSWDKMIIPKIFSKITILISEPLYMSGDDEVDKNSLEQTLLTMRDQGRAMLVSQK
jgi:lysophospholipid acyltransferase (LPLAT)-like uncharacterized protein